MNDVLETEIWQRLLAKEYVFSDKGMKQNDTSTKLKDKFESAAAKRNHYQATIISQDSHNSDFLALPQSMFNWRQGRYIWQIFRRCKNWEGASRESTKAAEGSDPPKRWAAGTQLWCHCGGTTENNPGKLPWSLAPPLWEGVWNVREDSKEERSNKNPKAFVPKSEGRASVACWESKGKDDPSGLTMEISGAE